jgi:hypothetical protein
MAKWSERDSITKEEYLQVVGLLALAKHHNSMLRDIERAALNILQEIDHDGKPHEVWGGGYVSDAIGGEHDAATLLDRIGLKVESE